MSSLLKKFIGSAGLQFTSKGLAVISGVIFARYLGAEQYGVYSYTLSIIALVSLPVMAGFPDLLVREVAKYHLGSKWDSLLGVISWSRWYILISSFIVILGLCFFLDADFFQSDVTNLLIIFFWLIPLRALLMHQGAILNGFRYYISSQLPERIVIPVITLIVLCFYFVLDLTINATQLAFISVFSSFFSFLLSLYLLNKVINKLLKKTKPTYQVKYWSRSLIPFSLITFISTLNVELAFILLGWLDSTESVAYFRIAMHSVILISLGLSSINVVIMPNVVRFYKVGNLHKTQDLLTKSVRLSTLISLPIILVLMFFGDDLISFLFGDEYLESYSILIVLCIGQLVNVIMGSVDLVLNMTGNESKSLKVLLITFSINVLFLFLLIPHFGSLGAAISVSLGMIVSKVLMAIDVWKTTKIKTWIM